MQIDGQLVNGEDLLPVSCGYFETLPTPRDLPQYDTSTKMREDFKNEQLILHYMENPTRILLSVTPQFLLEVISDLKQGKNPVPSGLMAEHFLLLQH